MVDGMNKKNLDRLKLTREFYKIPLFYALIAIVVGIGPLSISTIECINKIAFESTQSTVADNMDSLRSAFRNQIQKDTLALKMIAKSLSNFDNPTGIEAVKQLKNLNQVDSFTSYDLILPSGRVLRCDGSIAESNYDFRKESAEGPRFTSREWDPILGAYIIRMTMPVVKNGHVMAVLNAKVNLLKLEEFWDFSVFQGRGAVFVIDSNTLDILMNTWDREFVNLKTAPVTEIKAGYSFDKMFSDLYSGKSGTIVFKDPKTQKNIYFFYDNMEINDWRLAISVQEHDLYSFSNRISSVLNNFLIYEAIAFAIFLLVGVLQIILVFKSKNRKLKILTCISEIELLLLRAHHNKNNITKALDKIAEITQSRAVVLKIYKTLKDGLVDTNELEELFVWTNDGNPEEFANDFVRKIKYLPEGYNSDRPYEWGLKQGADVKLDKVSLEYLPESYIAKPIRNEQGDLIGVLALHCMHKNFYTTRLLDGIAINISMLIQNIKQYEIIEKMGHSDSLTDLLNRNSFEAVFAELTQQKEPCLVVYADANGLHELNNAKGHEEGDKLLIAVASELKKAFGKDCTYRVGGDEFVILRPLNPKTDTDENIAHICNEVKTSVETCGYYVSMGHALSKPDEELPETLKAAEKQMYQDKSMYYIRTGKDRRRR